MKKNPNEPWLNEFYQFIDKIHQEPFMSDEAQKLCENVTKQGKEEIERMQQFTRQDMIDFANWYRQEDTPENVERYFHYDDAEFLNIWLTNKLNY